MAHRSACLVAFLLTKTVVFMICLGLCVLLSRLMELILLIRSTKIVYGFPEKDTIKFIGGLPCQQAFKQQVLLRVIQAYLVLLPSVAVGKGSTKTTAHIIPVVVACTETY